MVLDGLPAASTAHLQAAEDFGCCLLMNFMSETKGINYRGFVWINQSKILRLTSNADSIIWNVYYLNIVEILFLF